MPRSRESVRVARAIEIDQRGVEALELGGFQEILDPPRRRGGQRDPVALAQSRDCTEGEQALERDQSNGSCAPRPSMVSSHRCTRDIVEVGGRLVRDCAAKCLFQRYVSALIEEARLMPPIALSSG